MVVAQIAILLRSLSPFLENARSYFGTRLSIPKVSLLMEGAGQQDSKNDAKVEKRLCFTLRSVKAIS